MDKSQESQVKNLIMGANLALEAHKFDKAKSICEQALKLDDNNPNIYLILLLAKYKVTEIVKYGTNITYIKITFLASK